MRTLCIKFILNSDDPELNAVASTDLFEDVQRILRAGYPFLREDELEVVWCADDWEPK